MKHLRKYNEANAFHFDTKKRTASQKTFYPTVDLMIETPDYGILILGFSAINKKYKLINWSSLKPAGSTIAKYDENVISAITKYVKDEINKLNIDETIDLLQLNVKIKLTGNGNEILKENI